MACQLKEAIALINTKPAARNALKAVEDNGKIAEVAFGKLVLKEYDKQPSELSLKEFAKGFGKLIRNVTGVKIVRDKQYALNQIKAGMAGFEISGMQSYTSDIKLAGYVTADEIKGTISEDFYKGIVDGTLAYADITDEASMVEVLDSEVANAFSTIKGARGSHFLLHELVHAGANEYMAANPNEPATKRIETIYNYVTRNYKDLGITPGYWQTNIEEFVAEALSNPKFMKELMRVVPTKPVSRLSNMYEIVLNNLLQMLGLKADKLNSLFDVLLDANLTILEAQDKAPTKEQEVESGDVITEDISEEPSNTTPNQYDKIRDELALLNQDIIELETEMATVDAEDRVEYIKEIAKIEKEASKLLKKLQIEGTIGDRLIQGERQRSNKTRSQLSDFFKAKMKLTNLSLFGDLFEGSFDKVKETVKVRADETTYFDGAKQRMADVKEAIRDFVANGMDQSSIKVIDTDKGANVKEKFQSISRLLLQGKAGSFILPDEVITAMAAIILDMLANAEFTRAAVRSDEDVNRLLGRRADTHVTSEERARVADIDFLSNTLANSMGAAIYKELGLTANNEMFAEAELLEDKMKTELGLMAVASMEHAGLIKINSKTPKEIYGKDSEAGVERINTVEFTGANEMYGKGQTLSADSRFITKILGTESRRVTPVLTQPTTHVVKNKSAMGKFFDVAKKSVKALLKAEFVPWTFNEEFMTDYLKSVSTEKGRQDMMDLLGYIDPETVHVFRQLGVNGKNAAIELQMKNLEDWYKEMKDASKTEMWFKYFFGKNGRFYLDSNVLNPQNNKLHRFSVTTGREVLTDKADVTYYKLGLAQAFGLDIDKNQISTTLEQFALLEEQLADIEGMSTIEAMQWINEGGITINNKAIHPHDPEHGMAGIVEYRRYVQYITDNKKAIGFEAGLALETDAVTSGYILKSLQMPLLNKMPEHLEGGGVFVGELVDSITKEELSELEASGGEFVKNADGEGGVIFKTKSFGIKAENKSKPDAYERPAAVMTKTIPDVIAGLKADTSNDAQGTTADGNLDRVVELALGGELGSSDNLPKISRNFMKSPFMVFNYGSGLGSIINSLADTTLENLYKMFEDPSKADQVVAILEAAGTGAMYDTETKTWSIIDSNNASIKAAREFAVKFKESSPGERLLLSIPAELESNIKDLTRASVGVALAQTFNTVYAPYIEAASTINKSFSTMFALFKVKLDSAIKAEETTKGRRLTSIEEDDVIRSLSKSMPAIETALSDGADKSKLLIYDEARSEYRQAGEGLSITGQAKVRLIEEKVLSGQVTKYELVSAMAAGAVIPIHYIDGSIMTETMLKTKSLGIHDAKLGMPQDILTDAKTYNKATADISSGYSLTAAVLSSFNETLNQATPEEIAKVSAQLSKGKEPGPTVESIYNAMVELHDTAEKGRQELYSKPIRYEHMALEGSHYDWNMDGKAYVKQEPAIKRNGTLTDEGTKADSGEYQHPIDSIGSSAIIPNIKEDGVSDKLIAQEVATTTNSMKKCLKG